MANVYPTLPRAVPLGSLSPEEIADAMREFQDYLATVPTVERVTFQGVATFPLELQVSTPRPFFVAFCGRPYPDNNTPVVEVLGLTFRWEGVAAGSKLVIESIDGVASGDSVTLDGIVVGERV